jgi:hypothetical protein
MSSNEHDKLLAYIIIFDEEVWKCKYGFSFVKALKGPNIPTKLFSVLVSVTSSEHRYQKTFPPLPLS